MSTHPTVPPLRRRTPPETIVPTHEPAPAKAPKNQKVMLYLPPKMLDDLDDMRLDARRELSRRVDRSELIRACIRLAMYASPDALMSMMEEGEP